MIRRFGNTADGVEAAAAGHYAVINPATLEPVAEAPSCTSADVEASVAAASRAAPAWGGMPDKRRTVMAAMADAIDANIDELALLLSREHGKPLASAAGEFGVAARILRYYAAWEPRVETIRDAPHNFVGVSRAPLGVVALIVPWNAPIAVLHMKLGPALAAGNTVIVKPAPTTPLATLRYVELLRDIVPPGVINTVTGAGEIGAALVGHPGIRKISFTGSTPTGRQVMRGAAESLKRLTLELGGNDAAILLDDVVPADIVERVFVSSFANAGQICMAIKRLYVHRRHHAEMIDRLEAMAERWVVGEGTLPGVQMGPVNNAAQYDIVRTMVDEARASGARVYGGGGVAGLPGYFIRPTIVSGIDRGARLVREEQFGPALPVLAFDREEDAVAEANSTEVGLCASVWSSDVARATTLAEELQAGSLFVNHHGTPPDPEIPFGGIKQSGFGHELGDWGVDDFSDRRILSVLR